MKTLKMAVLLSMLLAGAVHAGSTVSILDFAQMPENDDRPVLEAQR